MLSDTPPPPDPLPDGPEGLPRVVPPLPRERSHARGLPPGAALDWLRAGWRDLWTNPAPSLIYGAVICALSWAIIAGMFRAELDHFLFPALAGFMVIAPVFANGLYAKSDRLARGRKTRFWQMVLLRPRSRYQGLFLGLVLLMLFTLWIRAAVLIYALFFGVQPFPGTEDLLPMLFLTPTGWTILLVGSAVGALFAAFAFAISVFSVPMLVSENVDALSAMGISMAMVWNNLPVMLAWGALVLAFFALSAVTGLIGLIVIFPLLGHATWHAYRAIRQVPDAQERVFLTPA